MEIEAKFSVPAAVPGGPEGFFHHLTCLDTLGDFRLDAVMPHRLRDVYYDTSEGALSRQRVAIRLREQDGGRLITVKLTRAAEGGRFTREEMEERLTPAALGRAVAYLRRLGLPPATGVPYQGFAAGEPAGELLPVLEAMTARQSRRVWAGDRAVAELVLDVVHYRLPAAGPFHDIEVELADPGCLEHLPALEAVLQAEAGGRLLPSPLSKLGRGLRLLGWAPAGEGQ